MEGRLGGIPDWLGDGPIVPVLREGLPPRPWDAAVSRDPGRRVL